MSQFEAEETNRMSIVFGAIKTFIIGFFTMVIILAVQNNVAWYQSFDNCVNKGGVPGTFPIIGVNEPQFMCLPPNSPLIGAK